MAKNRMDRLVELKKVAENSIPQYVTQFFMFLDGVGHLNRANGLFTAEFINKTVQTNVINNSLDWIIANKDVANKEYNEKYKGVQTGAFMGSVSLGAGDSLDDVLNKFIIDIDGYKTKNNNVANLIEKIRSAISAKPADSSAEPGTSEQEPGTSEQEPGTSEQEPAPGNSKATTTQRNAYIGGAEAARKSVVNPAVINKTHWNLKGLADPRDAKYKYDISQDGTSVEYYVNGKIGGTLNKRYTNWNTFVANINAIPVPVTAPATTAPAPATQATTPAPAEAEAQKNNINPIAVANVKAVLSRASTKALAFWTRRNEMGRINDMLEKINATVYNGRGNNDVNIDYLARVVYSENKSRLGAFVDNSDMSGAIYRATPDQLKTARKGEYSQLVAEVLNAMNGVYDKQKRDNAYFSKLKGKAIEQPAAQTETAPAAAPPATPPVAPPVAPTVTPPVTPPAPAAPITTTPKAESKADDGAVKLSSRVDPRIKKLARLRRLRVRSQMEAATESSAQFGRSRVS